MSETVQSETTTQEGVLYCTVHPTVETTLRCNKCGRPMCTKCAVRTPVGYRCRECVRGQQQSFYNAKTVDPIIQGVVSVILGGIGSGLMGFLNFGFIGWLIAFWAGSAAGALIADVAHRLVGKRRGRYSWLVVAGGIVLGGLLALPFALSLSQLLFIGMAAVGAVGRLRMGR